MQKLRQGDGVWASMVAGRQVGRRGGSGSIPDEKGRSVL